MKKIITLLLCFISISTFAQLDKTTDDLQKNINKKTEIKQEGWTSGGLLNIGVNQGMLQNWAAGGERYSLAINGVFNGYKTYLMKNKLWENTLDLYYGLNYVSSTNFVPKKIDDRIDFSSRYGISPMSWQNKKILKNTYLMGLARVQTQFSKGFNYEDKNWVNDKIGISNLFSPAYITLALGAEYRPNANFNVFFSPAAARIIMASNQYTNKIGGAFGIDQNETMAFQFGAYLTAKYQTALTKNIDYRTRLDLYSNYLKDPQNIDILWDNFFAIKLSKTLGIGLGVTVVYDDEQPGQRVIDSNNDGVNDQLGTLGWTQLKQMLNVGFNYKF